MPPVAEKAGLGEAIRIADYSCDGLEKQQVEVYARKRVAVAVLAREQEPIGTYDPETGENETVFQIVEGLITSEQASKGLKVGDSYKQRFHRQGVEGLVVPLQTKEGRGLVDLVYDPAINGLTWKLPKGHPLFVQYPSLGTIWEDKSTGTTDNESEYINPKTLAEATLGWVSLETAERMICSALGELCRADSLKRSTWPAGSDSDEPEEHISGLAFSTPYEGEVLALKMTNIAGKRIVSAANLAVIGRLANDINGRYFSIGEINRFVAKNFGQITR